MRCIPCNKEFTGQVCYDQHLASEKHKRKELSYKLLNGQNAEASAFNDITNLNGIRCDACNISFSSITGFQNHSLTREHGKMVLRQNMPANSDIISSSSEETDNVVNEKIFVDTVFEEYKEQIKSSVFYATCDVCDKRFSGPETYKQHLKSEMHSKKVSLQGVAAQTVFSCEPCMKVFSGQVPYDQHMKSNVHEKKMKNLQLLADHTSKASSSSEVQVPKAAEINVITCDVCNVQCTGLIPFQEHLKGSSHRKNQDKKKMLNIAPFSQSSPEHSVQQQHKNGESVMQWETIGGPQSGIETDYLLPEWKQNFKVMSTEELKESSKIITQYEDIDFDKSDGKMIVDVKSENAIGKIPKEAEVLEAKEMNGFESKPGIRKFCHVCKVELSNEADIENHFSSSEHFFKKWL